MRISMKDRRAPEGAVAAVYTIRAAERRRALRKGAAFALTLGLLLAGSVRPGAAQGDPGSLIRRVEALERMLAIQSEEIATLRDANAALQAENAARAGRYEGLLATAAGRTTFPFTTEQITALQSLSALEPYLKLNALDETLRDSLPEVTVAGANLRVINGMGATNGIPASPGDIPGITNALGNLIVGYNERRVRGEHSRGGSHNIVVGMYHNFSSVGGFVAGRVNQVSGPYAVVSGGQGNMASGLASSVSGGAINMATGNESSISGGVVNTAGGMRGSVSGGVGHSAPGLNNWAAGGLFQDH